MVMLSKANVLIVGDPDQGPFERELASYLEARQEWASLSVESKTSPNLTKAARDANLVLMVYQSRPEEQREQDDRTLPHLRDVEHHLVLFAKSRGPLLDVMLDELNMDPPKAIIKITAKGDWKEQLLGEIMKVREAQIDPQEEEEELPKSLGPVGFLQQLTELLRASSEVIKAGGAILAILGTAMLATQTEPGIQDSIEAAELPAAPATAPQLSGHHARPAAGARYVLDEITLPDPWSATTPDRRALSELERTVDSSLSSIEYGAPDEPTVIRLGFAGSSSSLLAHVTATQPGSLRVRTMQSTGPVLQGQFREHVAAEDTLDLIHHGTGVMFRWKLDSGE